MLKTVTNIIDASQIKTPITLPGDVTLSTGNLIIGTSGKGIDFSATPGTGTSELLSDYEEGTWTPTMFCGATQASVSSSSGKYTKVGNKVFVTGSISLSSKNSGTGLVSIQGLPFSAGSGGDGIGNCLPYSGWSSLVASGSIILQATGSVIYLYVQTSTGAATLTDGAVTNSAIIVFSIEYIV